METQTEKEREKVINTNGVPRCPHCKKPTRRTGGSGETTLAYYAPIYDENGKNTNPNRNTSTNNWQCLDCGKAYITTGNHADGYFYK